MPNLNDYERLTDDELAEVVETIAKGQENPTRGVILLEAAHRLRRRQEGDDGE